jgi:hypothetical protein
VDVACGFLAGWIGGLIGALEKFSCVGEPQELAVEFEVECDGAAVKTEKEIFPAAADGLDVAFFCDTSEMSRGLRFYCDGMEYVGAANPAALRERAKSAGDGFDFGEFRHGRMRMKSLRGRL